MNNWHINRDYLRKSITEGHKILINPNTSETLKREVKYDIKVYRNFLAKNFEMFVDYEDKDCVFDEKVKNKVLNIMHRHYNKFKHLFDYLITLYNSNIFNEFKGMNQTHIDLEFVKELTLENYKEHSVYLYKYAKKLLQLNSNLYVEKVEDDRITSYVHYSSIDNAKMIIINPYDLCNNFNHELEHVIEKEIGYNDNNLYYELGPILFEQLFLDKVYDIFGYLNSGDILDRLIDIDWKLETIINYFKMLKELAMSNFEISYDKFIILIRKYMELYDDKSILEFIFEEIINLGIEDDLAYVFAYLKGIVLRKEIRINKDDAYKLLKPYLTTQKYDFSDNKDFKLYDDYLNSMQKRIRNK